MRNFPLRVIGFENKFHAVGCLIKGPHFVPETTSVSFLNLTKIWPKKYRFCPFLGYFPIAPLCHTVYSHRVVLYPISRSQVKISDFY